jgi:hypothetical protein
LSACGFGSDIEEKWASQSLVYWVQTPRFKPGFWPERDAAGTNPALILMESNQKV